MANEKAFSVVKQIKPLPKRHPGRYAYYCERCMVEWTQTKYESATCCEYCKRTIPLNSGQKPPEEKPIVHENAA